MSTLAVEASRTDIPNRLKRAEGRLRGIQRLIEQGDTCLDIAGLMSAVRQALDSTCVRTTVCFMPQELHSRLALPGEHAGELAAVLDDVQSLLGKIR